MAGTKTPPEKKYPYYVTTTDRFMSGWGPAKGKLNKLVFCCTSYQQAQTVAANARARSDQKNVNIRSTRPSYNKGGYYVQWFTPGGDYKNWYRKGAFQ